MYAIGTDGKDNPESVSSKIAGGPTTSVLLAMLSLSSQYVLARSIGFSLGIRLVLSENRSECHGAGVREPKAGLYLHEPSDVRRTGNSTTSYRAKGTPRE